jgi:CheY-like chemotaxis protein
MSERFFVTQAIPPLIGWAALHDREMVADSHRGPETSSGRTLVKWWQAAIAGRRRRAAARGDHRGPETSSGRTRRHRALVVDDNDDTRALYAMYLRHRGWEVEELANGEEALAVAKVFAPDIIVMDLAMPLVDGVEATRRLKRDPRTKEIPIIVVTAHLLRAHEAIAAGGSDFLLKPCLPQDLLAVLENIVTKF